MGSTSSCSLILIGLLVASIGAPSLQFFPLRHRQLPKNRLHNELMKELNELDLAIPKAKQQYLLGQEKQPVDELMRSNSMGDRNDLGKFERLIDDIIEQSYLGLKAKESRGSGELHQQYSGPARVANYVSSLHSEMPENSRNLLGDCRWRSGMAVGTSGYRIPCREEGRFQSSVGELERDGPSSGGEQSPRANLNAAFERMLDMLEHKLGPKLLD